MHSRLQMLESGLDPPPLLIESRQIPRQRLGRVGNRRHEALDRLGLGLPSNG
jgi:hypothetical protein